MRLLLGLKRLATKALAALPVLGCIVLLMSVATGPVATIVVTSALLVYLLAWDRVDAPEGRWQRHLARLAIPALIANRGTAARGPRHDLRGGCGRPRHQPDAQELAHPPGRHPPPHEGHLHPIGSTEGALHASRDRGAAPFTVQR
jgi:hypothetical protein